MIPVDRSQGVVLALGGGGMRGAAHLGVLAEFENRGAEVRAIAGTGSGALMGAIWLLNGAEPAIRLVRTSLARGMGDEGPDLNGTAGGHGSSFWRRLRHALTLARVMLLGTPISHKRFFERIAFLLPDIGIEALPRPFVVTATDSVTGREVRLTRGSLRLAVAASSAVSGLVRPFVWAGRPLQDGGAVAEIPVAAAKEFGSPVVAVEVSEALTSFDRGSHRAPRVFFRVAAIGWQELRRRILAEADAVIAPAVNHLYWGDYRAFDEAVEAGRVAAREFLDQA